jgi:pimeloyl-ACP methyl ester carboxylesterase
VVMVHGAGGSIEVWFRQVPDFARHFNLLLVDLMGHGDSEGYDLSDNFNFISAADQVMEVVDYLKIEKAHYMGLSLGCIIVRVIAENYASRVDKMVLAGAVTTLSIKTRFLLRSIDMFKMVIPYGMLKWLIAKCIIPQEQYARSKSLFLQSAQKVCFDSFLQWMSLVDKVSCFLRDLFCRQTSVPTLYMMGENDHLFLTQAQITAFRGGIGVSMIVVPNAGHVCNVDNKTFFNRASIDYLLK